MDRLSELPESILLHILSFLTTKDVVRTAVLSKRWQHLWTIIQELDINFDDFIDYRDFVDFVNRTLLSRGSCKIRRLRISLFLDISSPTDFVGWISYAAKNNVEELFIDFDSGCAQWLPPECVCCNSSLKKLSMWSCRFIPDMQIRWNLLTKLTLRFSVLWGNTIHEIMLGAPKLEFFELDSCWGYDYLTCDSPSLRVLIVREYEPYEYEYDYPVMRISAPNIQSLQLSGSFYRKCVLMNVPSVVRATLDFHPHAVFKWKHDYLMELIGNLKHVDSLTLSSLCIEVLAQMEKRRVPSHISSHKYITLNMPMKDDDLLGTVNMLKGSPDLEMLIIDMEPKFLEGSESTELADSENFSNSNAADYLVSQAKHIKCLLHHLKTVKITQFVETRSVFPFLEFILKNGRVLENLIIIAKRGSDENSPETLLKVAQRLLSLPRASSRAVVTLLN